MDAQVFITKKYEHNNWGFYPPSRILVGEWLEEFAKEYHTEQLRLGAVVGRSEQLKSFADWRDENEDWIMHNCRDNNDVIKAYKQSL